MSIDLPTRVLQYRYSFKDLVGAALSANVHHSRAGMNGPAVIALARPPRSSGGTGTGFAVLDASLAEDLCTNTTDYYIQISSSVFADGEIRGQLKPA